MLEKELGFLTKSASDPVLPDWLHYTREVVAFFGDDWRIRQTSDSFRRSIPAAVETGARLDKLLSKFAEPGVQNELRDLPETGLTLEIAMSHPVTGGAILAHAFRAGSELRRPFSRLTQRTGTYGQP